MLKQSQPIFWAFSDLCITMSAPRGSAVRSASSPGVMADCHEALIRYADYSLEALSCCVDLSACVWF
ncbi:Fe2+ transport system protein B [Pseudomonas syringae pv. actinidiae]|uniref:Fe2+ transport system protein B n=1 Tax=Pseudomonas syringae pv. actinidiae TaxID=103796 RepID=A0AAN4Q9X1_PSESF|nr:Fe2+ transport system protein B [Pseudomonas syringae pv. actinidiae]